MEAVRSMGRWPKRFFKPTSEAQILEDNLACRLRKAIRKHQIPAENEAELIQMFDASEGLPYAERVLQGVRALGRLPRRRKHPVGDDQIAENALARKFRVLQRRMQEARQTEVATGA